jgi:hypothetical protein
MGIMYSLPSYKYYEVKDKIGKDMVLLNTMPMNRQDCLIKGTMKANYEEDYMNQLLKTNKNKEIILYGLHHTDLSVIKKYNQLKKLGFKNVHIYFGGMFEWLLLQEVFGTINFEIDGSLKDIIEYKIE